MAILEILTYPNKFLRQPTKKVQNIDGDIQKIIDNMAETMFAVPGLGLAAIQVGIDKNIIVYSDSQDDDKKVYNVIINPQIISSYGEIIHENEGCLSVPDLRADVKRAKQVFVEGFDRDGKPINIEAEGLLSFIFQHEMDHLNGILFIDKISPLKRELYKRRIKKLLKNEK
ncbi:MAG: peptide deformylase [Desulfobacterales bacterium]|nr:peptide deformylase [Desulfobacterales bacterium]MBF0395324.1 peptide deformylase [Desulfobacterales bacterium]